MGSVLLLTVLLSTTTLEPACGDALMPLSAKDPYLQSQLQSRLRASALDGPVAAKTLAVSLVDLTQPGHAFVAGVNEDTMLYAASLPKIAILLAVVQLANEGRVQWTPEFAYRLKKMITVSDNHFASWAFDVASFAGIAEVVQARAYCLYAAPFGGLWLGRGYAKSRRNVRDPLFNLTHGATARQTARFYSLLHEHRLVSPYWSERMLDLMNPPGVSHKFVAALQDRQGVRFLARKSGTFSRFHSDSALILHHSKTYVLVGLAELWDGERALRTVASVADDLIMEGAHRQ